MCDELGWMGSWNWLTTRAPLGGANKSLLLKDRQPQIHFNGTKQDWINSHKKSSFIRRECVNEGCDQFEEKVCGAFAALSCFVTDFVWEFEVIGAGLWALTGSHPVQYGPGWASQQLFSQLKSCDWSLTKETWRLWTNVKSMTIKKSNFLWISLGHWAYWF